MKSIDDFPTSGFKYSNPVLSISLEYFIFEKAFRHLSNANWKLFLSAKQKYICIGNEILAKLD
jgi:hypothetical protein